MTAITDTRQYQSADAALRIIDDARTYGYMLEITSKGDIKAKQVVLAVEPRGFLQKLFQLFRRRPAVAADKLVMEALINKMKIEAFARDTVHDNLRKAVHHLEELKTEGNLEALSKAWTNIRDELNPNCDKETAIALSPLADMTAANVRNIDRRASVAAINQALPPSMVFDGNPATVITGSFVLPDSEHRRLLASLENTKLGEPPTQMKKLAEERGENLSPVLSRLASQTLRDCGRDHFCLKSPGEPTFEFETGADAVEVADAIATFGASSPGRSLETGSRLINQEALGALLVPLQEKIKTRDGLPFQYSSDRGLEPAIEVKHDRLPGPRKSEAKPRAPKTSETQYTWSKLEDGGSEFSIRQRQKIHFLVDQQGDQIPVNRGDKWWGDVNESNYGCTITTKIRLSAKDMETGNLTNVVIVEPLAIKFQIAPAARE